MHPVIFKLGPITVYSYGTMLALAAMVSTYLAQRRADKLGFSRGIIYDLSLWIIVSAVIGSRAFYVLLKISEFKDNPASVFAVNEGGLVLYGGLLLAILSGFLFCRIKKQFFNQLADLIAPYIALGIAIGRIGCFLNGCCYGKSIGSFTHPVQLYESFLCLLIFLYLIRVRNLKASDKGNFVRLLVLYSAARFLVEYFRGDNPSVFLNFTLPQACSIIIIISVLIWRKFLK
ncbi:MAG: prolipoprotein diacylglyceryl transferase [Candidatus Omnitrophota bacterium]